MKQLGERTGLPVYPVGGVSAVNAGICEGVVCADNVVRALFLPVGGQVAIGQVVTGQTLVSVISTVLVR